MMGQQDRNARNNGGAIKQERPPSPAGNKPADSCPVVGIGASAGGLEACKAFLDAMPNDSGIAFVLVLHLDPKAGSVGQSFSAVRVESLAGHALQTGGPVIVEDLAKEKRFGLSALSRQHGVVSGAGVLIGPEDERWGALCVLSAKKRQFLMDDVNFLQAVANVLSSAVVRARAEEDMRLARARLSAVLDNADDAIISVGQTQKITMFNHGAEKIFGYTAQEVMGQPLGLLMPVRFKQAHEEHVRGCEMVRPNRPWQTSVSRL